MSNQLYVEMNEYELTINNGGRLVFPMHDQHIIIYKGTDNAVDFAVYDDSRRLFNVGALELTFTMFHSRTQKVVLQRPVQILDSTKGRIRVMVSYEDVSNLNSGYYNFSVKVEDIDGFSKILHTTLSHRAMGVVKLIDGAVPTPHPALAANSWNLIEATGEYASNILDGDSGHNFSVGLHSAAVYMESFTGTLQVQFSLDEFEPTVNEDWVDLYTDPIEYVGKSGPVLLTFTKLCRWVRFVYVPDVSNTGTFDKVLLRN
jgi:hypothetical protein